MLWSPFNDFNWQVDNIGSTYTNAGLGTQLTSGGTNHTQGSIVSLLSALAFDCYWVTIGFVGGSSSGASRRHALYLYGDPAGGTSWSGSPIISGLIANSPNLNAGGVWYNFPLFIKAGMSLGASVQSETASSTVRVILIVRGKPSHPELIKVGRFVRTLGDANLLGTTVGITLTPGASGAMGAYTDISGLTADPLWWWQLGVLFNDTSQTAVRYWCDLALGDASNKHLVIRGALHQNNGTIEEAGLPNCGGVNAPPYRAMPINTRAYVRAACDGTADSNMSAMVYAVGG